MKIRLSIIRVVCDYFLAINLPKSTAIFHVFEPGVTGWGKIMTQNMYISWESIFEFLEIAINGEKTIFDDAMRHI